MFSFTLFAIRVRVDPWFWITMALLGYMIYSGQPVILTLIFVLAGFISILVHELGHALTIRKFGLPTEITLHGFGGYATYTPGRLTRLQSFLVTAAGPGLQIMLALVLIVLSGFIPIPGKSLLHILVENLIWVSIFWAILNCLPVYPLDGGQMMAAVLGPRREHLVYLFSVFLAVFIGIVSFFFKFLFLSLFMVLFAVQNWQMYQNSTRQ